MNSAFRLFFALSLLIAGLGRARAADDTRFSKSLSREDTTAAGLPHLSSDQIAVLDALVRRDIERADYVYKQPRPARFSERLSASEQHNAGLDTLSSAETARLDETVSRLMPAPRTGEVYAAHTTYAGGYSVPSVKIRRDPEIHGSVTLMVGAGSHGYTEYGGAAEITYYDPADRFAITVGYAETHAKGGYLRRGCYDPFWRPGLLW